MEIENNQMNLSSFDFGKHNHLPFTLEGHWQPFFDDRRDFNTNANSYYEYLAHINYLLHSIVDLLNRANRRNINVEDTKSIDLTKTYDWISEDIANNYHDIITLKADTKVSKETTQKVLDKTYELANAIVVNDDGLYVADYLPVLTSILSDLSKLRGDLTKEINDRISADNEIKNLLEIEKQARLNGDNNLQSKINEINNLLEIEKQDRLNGDNNLQSKIDALTAANNALKNTLTKILNNLASSGAWVFDTDILSGNLASNRNIATGNINIFGGVTDGNSFIRTNNGQSENDLAGGV